MKYRIAKAALAIFAWSPLAYAHAAEETDVPPSASTETRAAVREALVLAQARGELNPEEQTHVPAVASTLRRIDIVSDLDAWNRSGLAQEWHTNNTPDTGSASYLRKRKDYEQARNLTGLRVSL